ncbi:hypothetical protein ACMHYO_00520 [Allopusillimonas ginsengisoli]|uniref:hypothetical protein n=1 Tax=Allopusillimonas ginsengisoli TaxID=453575 RepID=UPI0039C1F633
MIALASCTLLTSCGTSDSSDTAATDKQYSSRIHVIASKNGRIAPAQAGDTSSWILTLENPEPTALWYTDRPSQDVGATPLKDYINAAFWRSAYGDVNPNATILFQLAGSDDLDGLYVSLTRPSYNEKSNTITFDAKILNDTLDNMGADSLAFTNVTLNVLNNAEDDEAVSSYIQYASQAVLQPTAVSDQYKVVLSGAGPDMIWVDNAPGQYSDSRPMSNFFPQWPYVFKDSPPNAALVGTTATGKMKLYFLTLTDPTYDEALKQVSYTAKLLGQTSGALEIINQAVLSIDSGAFSRFPVPGKGTGYQAFGQGYDPSTANNTYIYFGSDIARKQTGSLWGTQSYLSQSCEPSCRNDLETMKSLGINLVRLYDWDPRNDHSQFLDYADSLNIKVVVPISNWLPTQNASEWNKQVPNYFKPGNFGNKNGTDWHPAIAGVIISNELDMENGGTYYGNVIGLVARFLQEADKQGFSKNIPVGVPVTFVPRGAPFGPGGQNMPGWKQFNQLLTDSRTAQYKDRLMLCPNTYNSKDYLFNNAESTGQGWVQLTYKQFGVPILFTEIGLSRAQSGYTPNFVRDQLQGVLAYQKANPEQLLGAMHFQFDDKVWKQTPNDTDTEGAFGMYHHGAVVKQIQTVKDDFNFYIDEAKGVYGILTIDKLDSTRTYAPVVEAYK